MLTVERIGPGATLQDLGRTGYLAQGLSRGGATDRLALLEAAALLGVEPGAAAIEMTGAGGRFTVDTPVSVALTGAPLMAEAGGRSLAWNAVHRLAPGETLSLSGAGRGVWSYLSLSGGIETETVMGARATHLAAGLGRALQDGDTLPLGEGDDRAPCWLPMTPRWQGGTLRLLPSAHTALFRPEDLTRLEETILTRDPRSDRQGVRLSHDGAPFATEAQLGLVSEIVQPGDVQMTGDGVPVLLGPECQTVGGYPRIGQVVPRDMPRAMQAPPGAPLRLRFVTRAAALADHESDRALWERLCAAVAPLPRSTREIPGLGRHQLISGVTAGR